MPNLKSLKIEVDRGHFMDLTSADPDPRIIKYPENLCELEISGLNTVLDWHLISNLPKTLRRLTFRQPIKLDLELL